MSAEVKLEVTAGPMREKEFPFAEHDTFVFGRSPDCHACLPDDGSVSRHHFLLEANPPDARIRDLGSLNGTYVNNTRIGARKKGETPEQGAQQRHPEVDLKDGDKIKVGETILVVRVHAPACCGQCGAEVPKLQKQQSEWGSGYLCNQCRVKLPDKAKPAAELEAARCGKCGKEVAAEIGQGRRGDYICAACRAKVEKDPWQALAGLLEQAQAKRNGEPVPAIEGYEILRQLGIGGNGAVYQARRKKDAALVAVKVMLAKVAVSEHARKKFLHETEILKSLRHANIVSLLEHGAIGSAFYFVMEFCDAGDLTDLISRRGGRVSLDEATGLMLQALDGLAYAHGKGIVHRDLKPGNLLLLGSRANRKVKVSDFGWAKNFEQAGFSGMTLTGHFAGTPRFMPREQVLNFKHVKPVSDVWSIAATFYIMLTGWLPRDFPKGKDPLAVVLDGDVVPIRKRDRNIPKPLAAVIDRALEKNPKSRFQNAKEFREALSKAVR
jgi:DNA-directed RNA polymerase subunit RPC12/RpoP